MTSSIKKALLGALVSVAILGLCFLVLTQVDGLPTLQEANLSPTVLLMFFASVCLFYLFSGFMWTRFFALFGETRDTRDAFIDMGLIAIGKYLPGKVWGILFRGSVDQEGISLRKNRVLISATEISYSLIVGLLLVAFLLVSHIDGAKPLVVVLLSLLLVIVCALSLQGLFLCCAWLLPRSGNKLQMLSMPKRPGFIAAMGIALGYIVLWWLTATPLLVLIFSSELLDVAHMLSLVSAFIGAMIAGWLALFAPGGIGVRESAFVYFAPEFLSWQTGLFWITLHRTLFTMVDLLYGTVTLLILAYRSVLGQGRR